MTPVWVMIWAQCFPSTYGQHALDEQGRCHTRDPGEYVGRHRYVTT